MFILHAFLFKRTLPERKKKREREWRRKKWNCSCVVCHQKRSQLPLCFHEQCFTTSRAHYMPMKQKKTEKDRWKIRGNVVQFFLFFSDDFSCLLLLKIYFNFFSSSFSFSRFLFYLFLLYVLYKAHFFIISILFYFILVSSWYY